MKIEVELMTGFVSFLGMIAMFGGVFIVGSLKWRKKPTDWMMLLSAILLFISGIVIQIGSITTTDSLYGNILLMAIGLTLAIFSVIILLSTRRSYARKAKKYEKLHRTEETQSNSDDEDDIEELIDELTDEDSHNEEMIKKTAIRIYKKCAERDLDSFDSKKQKNTLMIITKSYDVDDEDEAIKMYELGKELVLLGEIEEEQSKIEKIREEEENTYNKAVAQAEIFGKMKYTELLEWQVSMLRHDKERETQEQDIEDKQRLIESIDEKLFDKDNQDKKFRLLKFANVECTVLESGNIEVSGNIKVNKELKILDADAILDGSLKVIVYDSEDNEVAHGYYSAPGFDETDLAKIGFDKVDSFNVLCKADDYDKIDLDGEYYCEIQANRLWIIEK